MKQTNIDLQLIEKEIKDAIGEKDLYRNKMIKIYEEDKLIEKAHMIKIFETSEIAKKIRNKFILIDNPVEIHTKVASFKKYKKSYLDSIFLICKEMKGGKNNNLFYSYLFMVSHYAELIIKTVLLNKNNEVPNNHAILNILSNEKDYLFEIGFKPSYFEYCICQLKQIGEYAATNDFSMCFRFPFDKNFKSKIITKKMINVKFSDIEKIVDEQKTLLMIFELMIVLSEKDFYKKVYEFAKELLNEIDICLEK